MFCGVEELSFRDHLCGKYDFTDWESNLGPIKSEPFLFYLRFVDVSSSGSSCATKDHVSNGVSVGISVRGDRADMMVTVGIALLRDILVRNRW